MQLFQGKFARKAFGFAALLLFSVPFGLTVAGCKHAMATEYCNSGDSGPTGGQVKTVVISQNLATYGESLNYGQIGGALSATAVDCFGVSVSVNHYTWSSTNGYQSGAAPGKIYADINPSNGSICAGTWNRNTGGGVADYTVCTPPAVQPTDYIAYVVAQADGASSNSIPIFVHAQPNSIQIGNPSSNCSTDPTTNCCPLSYTAPQPTTPYIGDHCVSQGQTGQVVARVLDSAGNNITCQVGHINYTPVGATNSVTFDQNGVGTANQPGSATITATIANSGSSSTAGFWSTCPAKSITLTSNGSQGPVTGLLGVTTPFTTSILDTAGNPITGLALEYESTTPETIQGGSNSITPQYPGSTTITAVCTPPACNQSPFSQIDLYSNGTPLTSNGVQFSVAGQSSSVIYIGSTSSRYIYPYDFTTGRAGALVKLPYLPNSMVISVDGSTIYMGSDTALMTVSTGSLSVSGGNVALTGPVLSVSPNGSEIVMTDPVRQTVSLVTSSGNVATTIGGVATSAAWSPDSDTVYITTKASAAYPTPQVLVHNTNTSWTSYQVPDAYTDVAVTVPHIGAYFAGTDTEGRSYCPSNALSGGTTPPAVVNTFYPVADVKAVPNEKIVATNDQNHLLGATVSPVVINDFSTTNLPYTLPCQKAPVTVSNSYFPTTNTVHPLTGVVPTDITDVIAASNSKAAFVTYTGTGALPVYFPGSATVSSVALSGTATAPVKGVFSSDDSFFYVDTAGDNLTHIITMTYPASGNPTATDTGTLTPGLPDESGHIVTPNLIVQRVKKPTS